MNFEKLKDFLDCYLPGLGIPGSDTVIYKDHEQIFRYASGFDSIRYRTPVRTDAIYHMYSCTKICTCVAATQLIERGELLMTDPLYAYFPEYRDMKVKVRHPDGSLEIRDARTPILIGNLLNMTAGFNYDLSADAISRVKNETAGRCPTLDVVRALASEPLDFDPGTAFQYSLGLDVVGGVIELVAGKPLGEYMRENIFEPLGMTDTCFGVPNGKIDRMATQYRYENKNGFGMAVEIPITENPYNFGTEYESGGAGLTSTVQDQILLADALTHLGKGKNGNRILSSRGVDLMRTNTLTPAQQQGFDTIRHAYGYGYGFGVRVNTDPGRAGNLAPRGEFGWDGAKLSLMMCDPSSGIAVFHAEHMGALHGVVIPRLRNIIYSCLDED